MKTYISYFTVSWALVASAVASDAEHFQSAEKLAAALYAPYQTGGKDVIPAPLTKEALPSAAGGYLHKNFGGVVAEYLEKTKDDPAGLGFDVLVDGQDFELSEFKIHEAEISEMPSGRVAGRVIVTFKNFGQPREIWIGVERVEGERPWQLTAIRAEKGHEGRSYDVVRLLESAIQPDGGMDGVDVVEVGFEDERSAALTLKREGGSVRGLVLVYSEGGHGAWRFTAHAADGLLVEILDDEGNLQHAEDATAWAMKIDGEKVEEVRHNKGTQSDDRQTWPKKEMKQEALTKLIQGLANLVRGDRENDVTNVEEFINAWMQCIDSSAAAPSDPSGSTALSGAFAEGDYLYAGEYFCDNYQVNLKSGQALEVTLSSTGVTPEILSKKNHWLGGNGPRHTPTPGEPARIAYTAEADGSLILLITNKNKMTAGSYRLEISIDGKALAFPDPLPAGQTDKKIVPLN